jgi:hypothetical protein
MRIGDYKPGDGEEGDFVPSGEVVNVEDKLQEREQEEEDIGGTGELGCHGVPKKKMFKVLNTDS